MTQPGYNIPNTDPFARTRPIERIDPVARYEMAERRRKRIRRGLGCFSFLLLILLALGAYFLAPAHTNLLILGIDRAPDNTDMSRSDTIMLVTINPLKPYVGLLSIPRDLWIDVPGQGENRINTVHFFAEINHPGSGPAVTAQVISNLFKVPLHYTVRLRFDGLREIVNALGGVDLDLPTTMGGLQAGKHHLNGDQALAFVRDRKGTDDFFRTNQQRVFVEALLRQMFKPSAWVRLPLVLAAASRSIDSNVPLWLKPRLCLAILRAGQGGIDARAISREMATPFITSGGADVLLPQWDKINPLVQEMFLK
jgi:LCP family protein required for cell wall assembly